MQVCRLLLLLSIGGFAPQQLHGCQQLASLYVLERVAAAVVCGCF
jgi:hypothetical protein